MLRYLSLTQRLTLFFTLVAASVLAGLIWLSMTSANRHFMELDRSSLYDKQLLVDTILADAASLQAVRTRLADALSHHHGLFVQMKDANGQVVFQTDDFPAAERLLFADQETLLHTMSWWLHPQQRFRALQDELSVPMSAAPLEITLAMDTAHHLHFLAELLQSLILYALAAVFVSAVLVALAVYYGLAPLRAIKAHAAGVTAQRLQARIPVESVPIEMADLVQALNLMQERLHDDFRRLSDFSSDLAHELRTPISNLLTETQVTLASPRDVAAYRDTLASNAEELQRLARMVSDMLLLAKTERGLELPNNERFMAADEARALQEFYEAVAADQNIQLTVAGDGWIEGDRLMVRRALSNLLSNALRHTPSGGSVQVIITESPAMTEIAVENTGNDIPPQALPRLFERFYRADPARRHPTSEGAGLGLAITKAIVEAHGGIARVSSAQGRTRFSLSFPHRN